MYFVVICFLFSSLCFAQNNKNDIDQLYQLAWEIKDDFPDSAQALNNKAISLLYKSDDNIQKGKVYTVAGILLQSKKDFDGAADLLLMALKLKKLNGDSLEIAKSLNNLGNTFFLSEHFNKSLEYLLQARGYVNGASNNVFRITVYNNLGNTYSRLGNRDSSLITYYSAESIIEDDTLNPVISDLYLNLGMELRTYGNYSSALKYFKKALAIQNALGDTYGTAITNLSIGAVYNLQGNFAKAQLYYEEADSLSVNFSDISLKKDILENRLILALKMDKSTNALNLFDAYRVQSELLSELNIENNIAEIEAKYQVEQNKKELALKEAENQKMNAENKRMAMLSLSLVLALGGTLFYLVYRTALQKAKIKEIKAESLRLEIDQRFQEYELNLFTAERIAQSRERKKIAGNLHDKLGGLLATMNVLLEVDNPDHKKTVEKVQNLIETSVDEVRNFSHELSENRVDNFSLKEQLQSLKESFSGNNKIQLDIFMDNFPAMWDKEKESELFNVILELTRNTFKHADASIITLQLQKTNDSANIMFEDNGKGFDTANAKKGIGMKSISNRIDQLNGTWSYDSTPGHGTSVNINIPLT